MPPDVAGLLPGTPAAQWTQAFGFAEAPLEQVSEAFAAVVRAALPGEAVDGPLEVALEAGLEACADWLLAPTSGSWVASFGEDPRPPAWKLPDRLGCRTLLVYASATSVGFSLRGPRQAGALDALRTLVVHADEPAPQVHGDPLPFEDAEPSTLGLDLVWLDRYLRELGVEAFDPDFYLPPGTRGLVLHDLRSSPPGPSG